MYLRGDTSSLALFFLPTPFSISSAISPLSHSPLNTPTATPSSCLACNSSSHAHTCNYSLVSSTLPSLSPMLARRSFQYYVCFTCIASPRPIRSS
uniref:Secreted protein n=1 Tax=Mesocestoides corti TaxID=53468 RepID=A0A5K3FF36_MESCO